MKTPTRKGTRNALLQAARAELVEGNGDLELAKVAKRAKVSDGLTYYHFGNRAGLIRALVDDYYQSLDEQVTAVAFSGDTWVEREKKRVKALVQFFYNDPAALLIATRLRTEPALAEVDATRNARLNKLGEKNIAQAQRSGEINASYNPLILVSMILAGATEGVRTALNTNPPTPIDVAQDEIWSFVARAAGVAPE